MAIYTTTPWQVGVPLPLGVIPVESEIAQRMKQKGVCATTQNAVNQSARGENCLQLFGFGDAKAHQCGKNGIDVWPRRLI